MSEEGKMIRQEEMQNVDVIVAYTDIPYSLIAEDMSANQKSEYYNEAHQIIQYYVAYKKGQEFVAEGSNGNYVPADLRYKKATGIINKEARFLFANPPTFNINIDDTSDEVKEANTVLQDFLDEVLEKNQFNAKLLKAAKDCFIGKRVAAMLNFNESTGITITFLNSLEFVAESDTRGLTKITSFYNKVDTRHKQDQRWFKKTYELGSDGKVYVEEAIFNGLGVLVEDVTPRRATLFNHIPAVVILNDGLTGETKGESELGYLLDYEKYYNKLANADVDAERKNMNPIRYAIDASNSSTKNLSTAPGSFWDLQSDEDKAQPYQAQVGVLEPSLNYSSALKTTLDRLENTMYEEVDVPNINSEKLQGVITSGKTLKALYWGLIVRCDEKMISSWQCALQYIAETIIEGARLYPVSISQYTDVNVLPDIKCCILVENNYPLPEDTDEEKNMDLAEINAQVMSRKNYLKKWRRLSDKEADEELKQIKLEQDMFDNGQLLTSDLFGSEE